MARLIVELDPQDVHGDPVADPRVYLRVVHSGGRTDTRELALSCRLQSIQFERRPAESRFPVLLTPSRYRGVRIDARIDDDGVVRFGSRETPLELMRRPSEWVPAFVRWRRLPDEFDGLRRVLAHSTAFQVGENTGSVTFADDEYDAVPPTDEVRCLAKMSLLNLYARLRREPVPGRSGWWFDEVQELLLATRERFVAVVSAECAALVRRLSVRNSGDYKHASPRDHKKNFTAVPDVDDVERMASVKTTHKKANLQLTVAHVHRAGRTQWLLDADIDENSGWRHKFDAVFKHEVTGGTHPIDVHELLHSDDFEPQPLGYVLEPRDPIAKVRTAIVAFNTEPMTPPIVASFGMEARPVRRIAVLGDSVPWGQGLLERQKMHALVATGFAMDGRWPGVQVEAHSGATIGVDVVRARTAADAPLAGEVPRAHPTILEQCDAFPENVASGVDVVIVNGGINDVDIRRILDPRTASDDLADRTNRACDTDLTVLLKTASVLFPNARIVVLTYYPILSEQSRFSWGMEFLHAAGAPPPMWAMAGESATAFSSIWDRVLANCRTFYEVSTAAIERAVAQVNRQDGGTRFVAANPGFGPEHAALAPQARLFGINRDLSPQDPVAYDRSRACDIYEPDPIRRQQCYRASVGHPNALGAQAYAAAVVAALAESAILERF